MNKIDKAIYHYLPREITEKAEQVYIMFVGGFGQSDKMAILKDRDNSAWSGDVYNIDRRVVDGGVDNIRDYIVKGKKISLWMKDTTQAIVYENVKNAYEKGSFYCIILSNDKVVKYPIMDIWRVVEN